MVLLTIQHLNDLQHFPASVSEASQVYDDVDTGDDLLFDSRQRDVHPHQNHIFQAREHVLGAVGVTGGHGAVMPRLIIFTTKGQNV